MITIEITKNVVYYAQIKLKTMSVTHPGKTVAEASAAAIETIASLGMEISARDSSRPLSEDEYKDLAKLEYYGLMPPRKP